MNKHEIKEVLQPYGFIPGGIYLIEVKKGSVTLDSLASLAREYGRQNINVQFIVSDGPDFSMRPVTPLYRNQLEVQLRLKNYTQTTVVPLPDKEDTALKDVSIDEYFDELTARIMTRLDEARVSLKEAQKQEP